MSDVDERISKQTPQHSDPAADSNHFMSF